MKTEGLLLRVSIFAPGGLLATDPSMLPFHQSHQLRPPCLALLRSASAQATDVVSGNEQTAADRCEHATLVLGDGAVPKSDIPEAVALTFGEGGEGVEALIRNAQTRGCLGQMAASSISEMAQAAAEDGFPLAVRLGDTQIFAVYNAKNQYVPGAWAYVRTTNVPPAGAAERSASQGRKGISTTPRFMCKVSRAMLRGG